MIFTPSRLVRLGSKPMQRVRIALGFESTGLHANVRLSRLRRGDKLLTSEGFVIWLWQEQVGQGERGLLGLMEDIMTTMQTRQPMKA